MLCLVIYHWVQREMSGRQWWESIYWNWWLANHIKYVSLVNTLIGGNLLFLEPYLEAPSYQATRMHTTGQYKMHNWHIKVASLWHHRVAWRTRTNMVTMEFHGNYEHAKTVCTRRSFCFPSSAPGNEATFLGSTHTPKIWEWGYQQQGYTTQEEIITVAFTLSVKLISIV